MPPPSAAPLPPQPLPLFQTPLRTPAQPFVKWAGGKRRLLSDLLAHTPASFTRYHEPFVGGGALFFSLASARPPARGPWATLSDANLRLVRTYRAVRDDPGGLIRRLRVMADTHDEDRFHEVRAIDPDALDDDADVAAWFIYLNKTAFNGLYRVNRRGRFNVPIGRYASPAICDEDVLLSASAALQGADIVHAGFEAVLDRAAPGDFVYFDPPYVPVSETASFKEYTSDGFTIDDQARLRDVAAALKMRDVQVLLSNSDTQPVRELYRQGFDQARVWCGRAINSKASGRGRVAELLIS